MIGSESPHTFGGKLLHIVRFRHFFVRRFLPLFLIGQVLAAPRRNAHPSWKRPREIAIIVHQARTSVVRRALVYIKLGVFLFLKECSEASFHFEPINQERRLKMSLTNLDSVASKSEMIFISMAL